MIIYTIVTGLTAATFLLTGLYVYANNPKKVVYQRCLIFSASVGFWSLGYFITLLAIPNFTLNILSSRISHAIGAFIPIVYLHFVWEILSEKKNKSLFVIGYLVSAVMFFACLTPLVVKTLLPKMGIQYYPEWGYLYPVYASLYLIFPGYAQYKIAKRIKIEHGTERIRLSLFFYALGFAFGGGVSLFLLICNIPFPPFFSVLIILYPPMMAYAILAYRFLDIEVIVKKTLVFAGISFFVFACFSVPLFLIPNVLHDAETGRLKLWLLALAGMAVAALVGPLNQLLVNITDKYLFQKKMNYHVLLREATEYLAHVASLRSLARTIVAFFLKKARLANASVYAFTSRENDALSLVASRPAIEDPKLRQIDLSHPIVNYFAHHQGPIEIDTIKELNKTKGFLKLEDIEEIVSLMSSLKAEAAVPCFGGKVAAKLEKKDVYLKAVLFLGHQKSDEPYSEEDLDVFFTLGQESSIAFENARLYDEVIERTRLLGQTNTDLSEANEKLKVTQASLIVAEKNATMVGMAKAIGHEVNNPLSTVEGRSVWIYRDELGKCRESVNQNRSSLSDNVVEALEKRFLNIEDNARRIEKSAKRIKVVVKTLTDILKDTKGEKGPLSLLVLCREAREATRFLTYDENLSGCQIVENIASNVVIFGNLEQLLQVFINMIKNAFEAMTGQQERRIEIIGNIDPDNPKMARIEFADNGPGIPEDVLPKIWGQGFSTKTMKENHIGASGQGQGLFVCKHMIESIHNGEIYAESMLGKGTTFVIKVPLADLEG
jgi:signal transduction histidine kinase